MFTTSSYVASSPAVVSGVVYVGSFDNNTYALDAATGALIWNLTTGYDICMQSSPAVHGDLVYTGSSKLLSFTSSGYTDSVGASTGDKICVINATTGATVWNYTTKGGVWSSPAVSDAAVYVGSGDNKLYALNASTGALQWSYETNGAIYSSPAFADGVVYVGSYDNNIYAIGSTAPAADSSTPTNACILLVLIVAVVFLGAAIILLIFRGRLRAKHF
jgi:outer membrane protein assembly factor BamB